MNVINLISTQIGVISNLGGSNFSIFEILMLLCFAFSWPFSIIKALKTKMVTEKSPIFMIIIIIGYIMGIIHKLLYNNDFVLYLYILNAIIVSFDLFLYYKYKDNKVVN